MTANEPVPAWAVVLRGFPGTEEDEVAAVFAVQSDASSYAQWWNREELKRHGHASGIAARAEEIDFYPPGTWRPPAIPTSERLDSIGPGG